MAAPSCDAARSIVYDDGNLIVGKYLDRFLEDMQRGSARESTYSRDKYLVASHARPALGRMRLKQGRHRKKLEAGSLYRDQGLVFAGEGGGLINLSDLRLRSFVPLLKRADLPRNTFHDLRHTRASLPIQKNIHPKLVQDLLGDASVAITLDTYNHMLPGMCSQAADAIGEALG